MPLLLLTISLGVVYVLNKHGLMQGAALAIGAAIILVSTGHCADIGHVAADIFCDYGTIDLIISVNLIQILGVIMEGEGVLHRIVDRLFTLLGSNKLTLFLIPVLIGFIPGPGVVLLSAPIVEEASRGDDLTGTEKSYINYWFRAAVQASWPLTFAFIIATGIIDPNKGVFF